MNTNKELFGLMDIPLSCSMFLEPALKKYSKNIAPVSRELKKYIHEWNRALIDIMKSSKYKVHLGEIGNKILSNTIKSDDFPSKCVEQAANVPLHSLHYALRFSESVSFLQKKIKTTDSNIKFVDLGCGFSPFAPAMQCEYNLEEVYCIDVPLIADVYMSVAEKVGGRAPQSISWSKAKDMASNGDLNTIVAMGVLPYMEIEEQVSRLKFINSKFQNFLVEIKYNNNGESAGKNVFDLKRLQKLKMDVENTQTLETALIQNSLRYLYKFMCAMPGKRYFLANDRSLFLSR